MAGDYRSAGDGSRGVPHRDRGGAAASIVGQVSVTSRNASRIATMSPAASRAMSTYRYRPRRRRSTRRRTARSGTAASATRRASWPTNPPGPETLTDAACSVSHEIVGPLAMIHGRRCVAGVMTSVAVTSGGGGGWRLGRHRRDGCRGRLRWRFGRGGLRARSGRRSSPARGRRRRDRGSGGGARGRRGDASARRRRPGPRRPARPRPGGSSVRRRRAPHAVDVRVGPPARGSSDTGPTPASTGSGSPRVRRPCTDLGLGVTVPGRRVPRRQPTHRRCSRRRRCPTSTNPPRSHPTRPGLRRSRTWGRRHR